MADADDSFDRSSWRRLYVLAAAVLLLSLVACGFGVASARRPVPDDVALTPGAPGSVSLQWTTRGLTWRKWEAPTAATQYLLTPLREKPDQAWDVMVFRTGRLEHATFAGRRRFPYRYWEIPADGVGFVGGLGILAAAIVIARAHHVRSRAMAGRCVRCGYDLRATPLRCPECGAAASGEVS